jgi:hypothetical protein
MASIYQRSDSAFLWMKYKDPLGAWKAGRTRYRKDNTEDRQKANRAAEIKSLEEKLPQKLVDPWEEKNAKVRSILAELVALPGEGFFVYLIKSGDLLKIGKTFHLRNRMAGYRHHNPGYRLVGVRTLKDVDQTESCEQEMHDRFKAFLSNGKEWFKDSVEIRDGFSEWHVGQLLYLNFLMTLST